MAVYRRRNKLNNAKSVNDYIEELNKDNKKVHYIAYLMIGVLILVLVVSVLKQFYLTLILLSAALLLQFLVFRRVQQDYIKKCENANLSLTTMRKIDADLIEEKGACITEEIVEKAHIIPFVPKTFTAFKAIKGHKDGIEIISSDISVVERKKDNGIAADVCTGNWIHFNINDHTDIHAIIIEDDLIADTSGKTFFDNSEYKEIELPEGFPKRFHMYVPVIASQDTLLPNDSFLNKFKSLSDYTPGKLGVSISDVSIDLFIKNRFLAAGFSPKQPVDEATLMRDPYPELVHALELTKYLSK